jgi:aminoacrylate hydrolase
MQRLAHTHRVIAHDHRGLGASDAWDADYSVDQIAGDVIGLMDAMGIASADIVGHSLGGAVAQALAVEHPDRIGKLVIFASWARKDFYFDEVMRMRADMLDALGVAHFIRTGPLMVYPPRWISENAAHLAAARPAAIAAFPGIAKMQRRIQACIDHDRWDSLAHIHAPTLVLGVADDIATPAYYSEEMAARIPGARLEILPYGGHNAHAVVPEALAACLLDFMT